MHSKIPVSTKDRKLVKQKCNEQHIEPQPLRHIDNGIFIRQKEFHKKYLYSDMLWIEASGNYCYIHLKNLPKIIVVEQLSYVETILPSNTFIRIHRSFIVNINSIDGFVGNQLCIGDARLSISAPYRKDTMQCFKVL